MLPTVPYRLIPAVRQQLMAHLPHPLTSPLRQHTRQCRTMFSSRSRCIYFGHLPIKCCENGSISLRSKMPPSRQISRYHLKRQSDERLYTRKHGAFRCRATSGLKNQCHPCLRSFWQKPAHSRLRDWRRASSRGAGASTHWVQPACPTLPLVRPRPETALLAAWKHLAEY